LTMSRRLTPEMVRAAVEAYNAQFAAVDLRLYRLSKKTSLDLNDHRGVERMEEFVRAVNGWGRTHARRADYPRAAEAALKLPWESLGTRSFDGKRAGQVVEFCDHLVLGIKSRGGQRQEWSWGSKIAHWIAPAQVPIYDQNVRDWLRLSGTGRSAYEEIVWELFEEAAHLASEEREIVGNVEPRTLIRAIDKTLWYLVERAAGRQP